MTALSLSTVLQVSCPPVKGCPRVLPPHPRLLPRAEVVRRWLSRAAVENFPPPCEKATAVAPRRGRTAHVRGTVERVGRASVVACWDRHQVSLYLGAIAVGAGLGLVAPPVAPALGRLVAPALVLLLFATFLGVPLVALGRGLRDVRFIGTVLVTNFTIVPLLAWVLSRPVADDRGLLLGVLLVLLTPCVDYVVVFTGLAGGDRARLLATAPLLVLVQVLLLPLYLVVLAGGDVLEVVEVGPFVEALVVFVLVPLVAAAVVQVVGRRADAGTVDGGRVGVGAGARAVEAVAAAATVPLLVVTLVVVVGSQVAAVGAQASALLRVVPLYVAFVALAVGVGLVAGRVVRLDVAGRRAVVFATVTRNSLVVLPLALALPPSLALAPLAVVTQTLVELVVMVLLVRVVPRVVPGAGRARPPAGGPAAG